MASSYGPLSLWYDTLTGDIPYGEFADFYEEMCIRDRLSTASAWLSERMLPNM